MHVVVEILERHGFDKYELMNPSPYFLLQLASFEWNGKDLSKPDHLFLN